MDQTPPAPSPAGDDEALLAAGSATVRRVAEADLPQLLELMRGYCDFYQVRPADADLAALSRALLADPEREGVQLLGLLGDRPVGFATVFWTWETTSGGRIGVMNDLFVAPDARGHHVGTALIEACADLVREHGGRHLAWVTAPDNARAQRVYDRLPTRKEHWLTYVLDLHPWTGATE